ALARGRHTRSLRCRLPAHSSVSCTDCSRYTTRQRERRSCSGRRLLLQAVRLSSRSSCSPWQGCMHQNVPSIGRAGCLPRHRRHRPRRSSTRRYLGCVGCGTILAPLSAGPSTGPDTARAHVASPAIMPATKPRRPRWLTLGCVSYMNSRAASHLAWVVPGLCDGNHIARHWLKNKLANLASLDVHFGQFVCDLDVLIHGSANDFQIAIAF